MKLSLKPEPTESKFKEAVSVFPPLIPLEFLNPLNRPLLPVSPPHTATIVSIPSYDRPDVYTVKFSDGSLAEYSDTDNVMEADSVLSLTPQPAILQHWIQGGANATLFIHNMTKPKHDKFFSQGFWSLGLLSWFIIRYFFRNHITGSSSHMSISS